MQPTSKSLSMSVTRLSCSVLGRKLRLSGRKRGATALPMPLYGYARVSTTDQDLGLQQAALKAAGCEVVRAEKMTGTTREGRTELATLLTSFVRATPW